MTNDRIGKSALGGPKPYICQICNRRYGLDRVSITPPQLYGRFVICQICAEEVDTFIYALHDIMAEKDESYWAFLRFVMFKGDQPAVFNVKITHDNEAKVYIAQSEDIPGLITESSSISELLEKLHTLIPELLKVNREQEDRGSKDAGIVV